MDTGVFVVVLIVFIIVYFIALICLCKGTKTVDQSHVMIIERLGKFNRILTPGLHWVWPCFEQTRYIRWRTHQLWANQSVRVANTITDSIDLREHVLDFPIRDVITKDNVLIKVDALIYFRVVDPRSAAYNLRNLPDALELLVSSSLRNIIAGLTLDETFGSRQQVNMLLIQQIESDACRWGIEVTRLCIEEIQLPTDILGALQNQIIEERRRRSHIIKARGESEAMCLRAKGDATMRLLKADAEKTAIVSKAGAQALANLIEAENDVECITMLQEALGGVCSASDYLYTLDYLEQWASFGRGATVELVPENVLADLSHQVAAAK